MNKDRLSENLVCPLQCSYLTHNLEKVRRKKFRVKKVQSEVTTNEGRLRFVLYILLSSKTESEKNHSKKVQSKVTINKGRLSENLVCPV